MEATEGIQDKRNEPRVAFTRPGRVFVGFGGGTVGESREEVGEGTLKVRVVKGMGAGDINKDGLAGEVNLNVRELVTKRLLDSPCEAKIGIEVVDEEVGNFVVTRGDRQALEALTAKRMPSIVLEVKVAQRAAGGCRGGRGKRWEAEAKANSHAHMRVLKRRRGCSRKPCVDSRLASRAGATAQAGAVHGQAVTRGDEGGESTIFNLPGEGSLQAADARPLVVVCGNVRRVGR